MLGVGSGSSKSGKIRRLVKNGLQAWYKADKTQAPLGEEEITNGDFNEKGPDIVGSDIESFFAGSDDTKFSYSGGLTTVIGTAVKYVGKGDLLEHEKTYKVTVDVVTLAGVNPKVYLGGSQSDTLVQGINVKYVTTAADGAAGDEWFGFNDAEGLVFRSYKVERTNLNDSWTTDNRTWTAEDGKLSHGEGTNDANQCRQSNVIQANKKYQVSYSIVDYTSGSVRIDLGDAVANQGTVRSAVGDYSEIITNTGTDTFLDIEPVTGGPSTFKGAISNISVREVTNSVKDFSPNTNNGVLYSGKALNFAGTSASDDHIDIDYWKSKTINADTKATFAVWFNDDNVSTGDFIFGTSTEDFDDGTKNFFFLGVIGGKLELGWHDSGWQSYSTGFTGTVPAVVDGTWYRAVAVIDGYTCSVYLNGELAFSKKTTSDFILHATGLSIGCQGDDIGDHWDGMLADFQIYDKAWTASDVTYDYNNPDKDVFDDEGRTEVLSAEKLDNTDFTTDSVWTKNNSADINTTVSNALYLPDGGAYVTQASVIESGKIYKYTVVAKSETNTLSDLKLMTGSTIQKTIEDIPTSYTTYTGVITSDATDFKIQEDGGGVVIVDSISVKEVLTHAGEISPTDCTALYRLNEGAGDRLYNAAPVLREDLLSGYDLDNWIELENSDIINSTTFNTTGGNSTGIYLASTTTEGRIYKLTIAGTTDSNGLQFANPGEGSHIYWDSGSSTGNFSDTIIFEAKHTQVYLKNKTAGTTTITTLKLQEISLSESYVQASFAPSNWKTAQPYIPQYAMSSYSKKAIFGGAGSGDYVELGTQKTIAAADAFSFSFWYYNIDTSNSQVILGKDGSTDDYLSLGAGDESLIFKAGGSSKTLDFNSDLIAGKLNHIVLTSPGGTGIMKSYLNGTLQDDTETSLNADFDYRHVFRNATDYGKGFIDELAHFSKELSATEVQEVFNAGMALDCRDHSAFLGDEEFDDPGFDDPSEWETPERYGTKWVVSGGKASVDTSGTIEITDTLDGVTAGKMYDISFEISDYSHGSFQFAHGRFHDVETSASIPNVSGNGIYKYRTIAQGSGSFFMYLYAYGASKFSIDNISVKEVDLKGYWRNNGTDTWTDLSPYGNNGTVNGSPTTIQLQEVPYFKKDTFGLPMNKVRQKGLNFDRDSWVKVEDDNSLSTMSGGFTCSFWFLHSENIGSGNWHYLVTKGKGLGADPDNGFSTTIYENTLYFDLNTKTTLTGASYGADPTITYNANSDVASDMLITGTGVFEPEGFLRVGAVDSSNTSLEAEDKDGNSQNVSGSNHTSETITLNQRSTALKTLGAPSNPTWRYITATYTNDENLRLYVDEELVNTSGNVVTGDVSTAAEAHPIVIGSSKDYNYKSPQVIDDVKWYNRPLELSEIKKNYKATKSRHSSTSTWSDDFSSDFI